MSVKPDPLTLAEFIAWEQRAPEAHVEVLSESTAGIDGTDKLDEYQTIDELEEYVLVDSRKRSVRIYRRDGEKLATEPPVISGTVELRSLDQTMSLDDLYEDVAFERVQRSS